MILRLIGVPKKQGRNVDRVVMQTEKVFVIHWKCYILITRDYCANVLHGVYVLTS